MVITPTLSHGSDTRTLSKEHETMIRSTQRKMLRLIVQTERKYQKKTQPNRNEEDKADEKANHRSSDEETAEGGSSNTDCDQDSDISTPMKRLTQMKLVKKMGLKTCTIPSWIETHRRMKFPLAMRIAPLPDERWAKKAAKWNPGFSTKDQTNRPVGRPKKRWEDETNDFLKCSVHS